MTKLSVTTQQKDIQPSKVFYTRMLNEFGRLTLSGIHQKVKCKYD